MLGINDKHIVQAFHHHIPHNQRVLTGERSEPSVTKSTSESKIKNQNPHQKHNSTFTKTLAPSAMRWETDEQT